MSFLEFLAGVSPVIVLLMVSGWLNSRRKSGASGGDSRYWGSA